MLQVKRAILTHGGAGSSRKDSDGTAVAAKIAMKLMKKGAFALEAVVKAVRYLEDDPRFNAGYGSQLRNDGYTIQLDASCMISNGQFGAVACVERIQNPIDLAHGVLLYSPHIFIVGEGARLFAIKHNIILIPLREVIKRKPNENSSCCDTVGAVAFDGKTFAVALSSGGTKEASIGRVGDVPLPGCGLFCGPKGAVACTGDGEFIALKIMARMVYDWLEKNISPNEAAQKAIAQFADFIDFGIIILTKNKFAAIARNAMAWTHFEETGELKKKNLLVKNV